MTERQVREELSQLNAQRRAARREYVRGRVLSLHAEGVAKKEIARRIGADFRTVQQVLQDAAGGVS